LFIEYTRLLFAGGSWIFTFAYWAWIYEDSRRHNTRAWPYIVAMLAVVQANPVSGFIAAIYDWSVLPSRGVDWYAVARFTYDASQFVEPLWVLDALFMWNLISGVISSTISYMIIFWIYKDCQKSGTRATPWIFAMVFVQNNPFPLSYVIPLGGYSGQVIVLIGYILAKVGYIKLPGVKVPGRSQS